MTEVELKFSRAEYAQRVTKTRKAMETAGMRDNPITATVDFEADGLQHGFLKLPHSHYLSAWGSIMIPITVVKNGTVPTALLTGSWRLRPCRSTRRFEAPSETLGSNSYHPR